MAFELTDDGTMDTVVRCADCGAEMRYNYQTGADDPTDTAEASDADADAMRLYDAFVDECIADAESEHTCPTFHVATWFERDRAHVALYYGTEGDANDDLIVEWWDQDVAQAIEDGFLNPRDFLASALEYARDMKLTGGK